MAHPKAKLEQKLSRAKYWVRVYTGMRDEGMLAFWNETITKLEKQIAEI